MDEIKPTLSVEIKPPRAPRKRAAPVQPKRANTRMYLNLRLVASVDFRRGVPRHYDELRARKLFRDIREDETILLISQTGQQLAFVFREVALPGGHGHEDSRAIGHFRIQLDKKRTWNPAMLSYYAEQAGIELAHVKRFEDHLAHLREERAE